jgi:hypothetical protein
MGFNPVLIGFFQVDPPLISFEILLGLSHRSLGSQVNLSGRAEFKSFKIVAFHMRFFQFVTS